MDATLRGAAARVARRRHHSFSDAVDGVLAELERALPAGTFLCGVLKDGKLRVIQARGGGVAGLAEGAELSVADGAVPEPEQLRALGVKSFVAVPLETSDGHYVGSLCAAGDRPGLYEEDHLDLLTVLARLLAREWEIVRFRAELLGLSERMRDEGAHPVTGLADRARLVETLAREWALSRRGRLASQLMLCRIEGLDRVRAENGDAMASLLLKDLAEALDGSLREVDHTGHVSEEILAGVLVGCPTPEDGERAVSRLRGVIDRVLAARPVKLNLAFTVFPLQDAASPRQLLHDAESEVRAAEAVPAVAAGEAA